MIPAHCVLHDPLAEGRRRSAWVSVVSNLWKVVMCRGRVTRRQGKICASCRMSPRHSGWELILRPCFLVGMFWWLPMGREMDCSVQRVCDQRMVVFNAVEERDLRSVNSDACAVRLCCWEAAVMCMPKGVCVGSLRLPVHFSRCAGRRTRRNGAAAAARSGGGASEGAVGESEGDRRGDWGGGVGVLCDGLWDGRRRASRLAAVSVNLVRMSGSRN